MCYDRSAPMTDDDGPSDLAATSEDDGGPPHRVRICFPHALLDARGNTIGIIEVDVIGMSLADWEADPRSLDPEWSASRGSFVFATRLSLPSDLTCTSRGESLAPGDVAGI